MSSAALTHLVALIVHRLNHEYHSDYSRTNNPHCVVFPFWLYWTRSIVESAEAGFAAATSTNSALELKGNAEVLVFEHLRYSACYFALPIGILAREHPTALTFIIHHPYTAHIQSGYRNHSSAAYVTLILRKRRRIEAERCGIDKEYFEKKDATKEHFQLKFQEDAPTSLGSSTHYGHPMNPYIKVIGT